VLAEHAAGGRTVSARAESTMVVYDLQADRPRRLSAADRERLEGWRGEPVALRRRRVEQRRTGA
jgi:hypothetical protein